MELKVVQIDETTGVFDVRGVTPSFLNALRRTLMSQVAKLAIEDVTIYDNTSALFDEMVAHRLGLLPVPTDLNAFNFRRACVCGGEGCPNCTVLFTLSKEGPTTVYSGDLVPAADAKYKIVDPKVPVVKLLEGQRLMLEAGAILGTGAEHAKWQAVTAVGYMEYPTVKVNGPVSPQIAERIARLAPKDAVNVDGNSVRVLDPVKAHVFMKSVRDNFGVENIEIGHEADRWLFRVETDGALRPEVALRSAVATVMEKLKFVESETPKLKELEQAA